MLRHLSSCTARRGRHTLQSYRPEHVDILQKPFTPEALEGAIEHLRFDYDISGDDTTWRALRAFDDGRQTFIEFHASIQVGQVPPLFLVNAKGEAELVNYRLRGRYYVVDRLFDVAELRLGTETQQIVRIRRVGSRERTTDGRRGS